MLSECLPRHTTFRYVGSSLAIFKKVKLSERHNHELEELFSRRKMLRMKTDDKSREELKKVESELASKSAQMVGTGKEGQLVSDTFSFPLTSIGG